jgi:putative phosphoribosyl transferase
LAGQLVQVPVGDIGLAGILACPAGARGIVVFAHGSGTGRLSPRNRAVADTLFEAGFGTLLVDLLTPDEEARDLITGRLRFDIRLLADRVIGAIDWLAADAVVGDLPPSLARLPLGCFGASTGAAAALMAAAERRERVAAVVCRGGRPDLAGEALGRVTAPTLLIVAAKDAHVLRLNGHAQSALGGESRLEIVSGPGELFEEPGALERAAALTRDWFGRYLQARDLGQIRRQEWPGSSSRSASAGPWDPAG